MDRPITMLDLFAGIGGFSVAGHSMGWQTSGFVEWDRINQLRLKKNFPGVPVFGDIRSFDGKKFVEQYGTVDLICGGFPCQPFSAAGQRSGKADDRYLWPEMLRVIREVKPAAIVGENVAGLVTMDGGAVLDEICTSLENEGYTVEIPFILPAIAAGAPHRRDRIWIVAYCDRKPGVESPESFKQRTKERGFNRGNQFANLGSQVAHLEKVLPTMTDPKMMQRRKMTEGENRSLTTGQKFGTSLDQMISQVLPTLAARDYKGQNSLEHFQREDGGRNHLDQLPNRIKAMQILPTLLSSDGQRGPGGPNSHTVTLGKELKKMTPAQDSGEQDDLENLFGTDTGLKLSPIFAEWMMGYPRGWTVLTGEQFIKPLSCSVRNKWDKRLELIAKRLQTISKQQHG